MRDARPSAEIFRVFGIRSAKLKLWVIIHVSRVKPSELNLHFCSPIAAAARTIARRVDAAVSKLVESFSQTNSPFSVSASAMPHPTTFTRISNFTASRSASPSSSNGFYRGRLVCRPSAFVRDRPQSIRSAPCSIPAAFAAASNSSRSVITPSLPRGDAGADGCNRLVLVDVLSNRMAVCVARHHPY